MPPSIPARTVRRKVHFPSKLNADGKRQKNRKVYNMVSATSNGDSANSIEGGNIEDIEIIRDLTTSQPVATSATPAIFTNLPPIQEGLETESSKVRLETAEKCLPFLANEDTSSSRLAQNSFGIPNLRKDDHGDFLRDYLKDFPSQFVALDASRPWLFYWSLAGLSFLGQDISEYRERLIQTVKPLQNPAGGFGGGHGQRSHIAASYATVLSLAIVGGEEALGLVDRKAMWQWLGSVKQKDGGFQVARGGEEDMRGAYCAMTIISLLNLPLELPAGSPARIKGDETFLTGLMDWISRCQSFEGGIGAAPGNEAHGGYAFCALACLCIIGEPHKTINGCLNIPLLLSWLSAQQTAPEGGFAGRTNKLVDACYSHWVGGCWALLEAAMRGPGKSSATSLPASSLWSREGLVRYLLCCCQGKNGGLRDKPGTRTDAYHTCYSLAGLNAAQNHYYSSASAKAKGEALSSAFDWKVDAAKQEDTVFDEDDRVRLIHPVYVLPWGTAEQTRAFFNGKTVDLEQLI
ncbi:MAG: CAAX farnesyltransferase (FTase) subunit beta [Bathelium mastoideum]|nr:MAG: CAAX farnesyltransferase (FTase) subunit beta [Bathelium mastoideum]